MLQSIDFKIWALLSSAILCSVAFRERERHREREGGARGRGRGGEREGEGEGEREVAICQVILGDNQCCS